MCRTRIINRKLLPLYLNVKHKSFSTYKHEDKQLEAVSMNYNLYGDIRNPTNLNTSPLIVMHGLFGSKSNWNSLCKAIQQKTLPKRVVISVDARNHGESPHSPNHSYEYLAEDIRMLLNQLNIEKAALLGHSMGGRAMMYFALKHPNLVEKLIVGDISPVTTSRNLSTMPKLFSIMENVRLPSGIPIAAARLEVDKELSKSIDDKGLRAFLLTNLKQNPDGSYSWRMNLRALINNFQEHIALFPKVDNVTYDGPVLFLAGGNSDFVPDTDYSGILKLFPKAELKRISGAGHWLHSEKPAEFLQLTLEFLNKID